MRLVLHNGWPIDPPTAELSNDQIDALEDSREHKSLTLAGVLGIHWAHQMTVEFRNSKACEVARRCTGWVGTRPHTLTAPLASGGEHAAIIAGPCAYSDFDLIPD